MAIQHLEFSLSDFHRIRRISFTNGDDGSSDDALAIGDVFDEDGVGNAEGYVVAIETDTGAWADGDAAGTIWYVKKNTSSDEFAASDTCSVTGKTTTWTISSVDSNDSGVFDIRTNNALIAAFATYTPNSGYTSPVTLLWMQAVVEIAHTAAETYGVNLDSGDYLQIPFSISHGRNILDHREGSMCVLARWDESDGELDLMFFIQPIQGEGDADSDSIPECVMSVNLGSTGDAGDLLDLDLSDVDAIHITFETTEDLSGGGGGSSSKDPPTGSGHGDIQL